MGSVLEHPTGTNGCFHFLILLEVCQIENLSPWIGLSGCVVIIDSMLPISFHPPKFFLQISHSHPERALDLTQHELASTSLAHD